MQTSHPSTDITITLTLPAIELGNLLSAVSEYEAVAKARLRDPKFLEKDLSSQNYIRSHARVAESLNSNVSAAVCRAL